MAMKQLAESRGVDLGDATNYIRLVRDLRDEADEWLIGMVRDAIEAGHERSAPLILARAQRDVDKPDEAK
jgi:hypothetical protein